MFKSVLPLTGLALFGANRGLFPQPLKDNEDDGEIRLDRLDDEDEDDVDDDDESDDEDRDVSEEKDEKEGSSHHYR